MKRSVKSIILPFCCAVFMQCSGGNSNNGEIQKAEENVIEPLTVNVPNTTSSLYLWDELGNSAPLNSSFTTRETTFIYNSDIYHPSRFIIPADIGRIQFVLDSSNKYWHCVHSDKGIEAALNFDVEFKEKIMPILNFKDNLTYNFYDKKYFSNPQKRDSDIEKYYQKKHDYLNEYVRSKNLKTEYHTMWESHIRLEKLNSFYSLGDGKNMGKYPAGYLKKLLNQSSLRSSSDFENPFYKVSLINELKIKTHLENLRTYEQIFRLIKSEFRGGDAEFLTFHFLNENFDSIPKAIRENTLKTFLSAASTQIYKDALNSKTIVTNSSSPDAILFNTDLKNLAIKEAFKSEFNYIDIWASWCKPCIQEFPFSKKIQQEYSKYPNLNFIYLSVDENPTNWEKGIKSSNLDRADCFLLKDGFESEWFNDLKINEIPRYLLIDKTGKIINANAPRPSDPNLKELFDELLR